MTTTLAAMNARARARSLESQPEPATGASLGIDETPAASQPDQPPAPVKKTVAALTRNIEACENLLAQYPEKISRTRQRKESTVPLEKEQEKLIARKALLERLRAAEARDELR